MPESCVFNFQTAQISRYLTMRGVEASTFFSGYTKILEWKSRQFIRIFLFVRQKNVFSFSLICHEITPHRGCAATFISFVRIPINFFCSSEMSLIYLVFWRVFFSSFTEKCTHKNENRFDCSHVYERTKYFNFFLPEQKTNSPTRIYIIPYSFYL